MVLQVLVSTNSDIRVRHRCTVGRDTREVGNLVLVISKVVVNLPEPVLGLDGLDADGGFDTGILQRTDVLPCLVAECRHGHGGRIVQQVGGLAVVPVDAGRQTLVEEAQIKTYIISGGGLPLQVGCEVVGTVEHAGARDGIETVGACRHRVGGNPGVVVVHVLLSGLTPAEAELQVAQGVDILEEVLVLDSPGQCHRGEQRPVVLEAAGAVVADGGCQVVLFVEDVVHTSEE